MVPYAEPSYVPPFGSDQTYPMNSNGPHGIAPAGSVPPVPQPRFAAGVSHEPVAEQVLPEEPLVPTPPSSPTPSQRSHHRRNVSDTSALVKPLARETCEFLAPFEVSQGRSGSSGSPPHWNPFALDQVVEDHLFGQEFDKIRRGSQSSISNVKSRESLVMSSGDLVDPFGAAPFSRSGKVGRSRSSSAKTHQMGAPLPGGNHGSS